MKIKDTALVLLFLFSMASSACIVAADPASGTSPGAFEEAAVVAPTPVAAPTPRVASIAAPTPPTGGEVGTIGEKSPCSCGGSCGTPARCGKTDCAGSEGCGGSCGQ